MITKGKSGTRARWLGVTFAAIVPAGIAPSRSAYAAADKGWYTQAQAARGQQLFNNYCAQCHRLDLTGAEGPALLGDAFLKQWSNRPLGDLYSFGHSNMPANNPGSLPPDTMWAITAYILQKNGFPAGSIAQSQPTGAQRILSTK
jgi:S-disulfanyl-L-cysteine oxidoreductase SoxD